MVGKEQIRFAFGAFRNRGFTESGKDLPEAVLGMGVVESRLPGTNGREGTENQLVSICIDNWWNIVMFHIRINSYFLLPSPICSACARQVCHSDSGEELEKWS